MSDSLWPHGLEHARLLCPSLSPGAYSNSCPLSRWCHPTISSVISFSFSSCLKSYPASGSFPMSQLYVSGGQTTGASASASVLPMNIQCWFPLGFTGSISLLESPRDSEESSPAPQFEGINSLVLSLLCIIKNDKIKQKVEVVSPFNHNHVLTGGITSHLSTLNG